MVNKLNKKEINTIVSSRFKDMEEALNVVEEEISKPESEISISILAYQYGVIKGCYKIIVELQGIYSNVEEE